MGFPARRLRRLRQHEAFRGLIRENTVQNTAKSLPQVAGIHLDTASVQPQNHPVVANPPSLENADPAPIVSRRE
jgi:hypothetical protein